MIGDTWQEYSKAVKFRKFTSHTLTPEQSSQILTTVKKKTKKNNKLEACDINRKSDYIC